MKVIWNKFHVLERIFASVKSRHFVQFHTCVLLRSTNIESTSETINKNRHANVGGANNQIKQFLEKKPEVIQILNSEFAHPYIDVNDYKPGQFDEPTESPLYNFYIKGHIHKPAINIRHVLENVEETKENIERRKTEKINIDDVIEVYHRMQKIKTEMKRYQNIVDQPIDNKSNHDSATLDDVQFAKNVLIILKWVYKNVEKLYLLKALDIPNQTYPKAPNSRAEGILEVVGSKPSFNHELFDHKFIGEKLRILRQDRMSNMTGHRNFFLYGAGAELEQALVQFTLDHLQQRKFIFISSPNILKDAVFEGAGLVSRNMDKIVYSIGNNAEENFHLAGTSELALCAYFSSHAIQWKNLPVKACSVSTCYRRETGTRLDRTGIFRVHQFLKVEMFGVAANETGNESDELHQEFVEIQKELFQQLDLHFEVVDMPAYDLGLPAYRKIDIEAWFPGRNKYDEISSASNCTDYQSRRLHILYKNNKQEYKFAHTVNATACAVPRMIIALLENGQQYNREVKIPVCLQPYMNGRTSLSKDHSAYMEYIGIEQSKNKQVILSD